ncbi:MAG: NADH:ubiquinone oxidoreductase subunit NDUFA12 [Alphaproteobacteria bacterium]
MRRGKANGEETVPGNSIGTQIWTWLRGEQVGTDEFGNRYFRERRAPKGRPARRWVLYAGSPEASAIPPERHGWLHYLTDAPLVGPEIRRWPWQRRHQPNQTGTPEAYRPSGHILKGRRRAEARGDYEPWRPA